MDDHCQQLSLWQCYCLVGLGWLSVGCLAYFCQFSHNPIHIVGCMEFCSLQSTFSFLALKSSKLGAYRSCLAEWGGFTRKVRNRVLFLLWCSLRSTSLLVSKLWLVPLLALTGMGTTVYLMKQPVT